jgi:hypothetical protein
VPQQLVGAVLAPPEGQFHGLAPDDFALQLSVRGAHDIDPALCFLRLPPSRDINDGHKAPLGRASARRCGQRLQVGPECRVTGAQERYLAAPLIATRKYSLQKDIESRAMLRRHKELKATSGQAGSLRSEQCGSGQINLQNQAMFIERKIADWGEIIEVREFLKARFNVGLGLSQLLILQLQLDLMDSQFLQKPLCVGSCIDPHPFIRLLTQPRFGNASKFVDARGRV